MAITARFFFNKNNSSFFRAKSANELANKLKNLIIVY